MAILDFAMCVLFIRQKGALFYFKRAYDDALACTCHTDGDKCILVGSTLSQ